MSGTSDTDRSPVYFLLHVPKTAGQTIQMHLARHCARGVFWQSQRRLRTARRRGGADFPDFHHARVVCGHHIGRSLEQFFPGREIRRIVLLRDPLQLQISFYNMHMMEHLTKGFDTYNFKLHLQAFPRDFIAHFLLSRWLEIPWPRLLAMADTRKYALLNQALANFWFVGGHLDCDRVVAAIAADLGLPQVAPPRNTSAEKQAHTGWPLATAATLPSGMQEAFRANNCLDQALWESWRDAGLEPAKVRPVALRPGNRGGFLAHEIIRPWFVFRCFAKRRRTLPWAPGGAALQRADDARDAGKWGLAARHYREALRALPNASAIWVQYGHALKESGCLAEAEQAYRQSLKLNSDVADTHLQLGHALRLQGRRGEAEQAYLRSAALDPAAPDACAELIALGWTPERIAAAIEPPPPPIRAETLRPST